MKTFTKLAAGIFSLIAALHALRLWNSWEAIIGGWAVPFWLSGAAVAIAVTMAWGLWKESK